jgi:cell wall-associated NlpC family hydrolase
LTVQARAVVGAQSLASVPATAAWTLDIPALTIVTPPAPAVEEPVPPEPDAPSPADAGGQDSEAASPADSAENTESGDDATKVDKKAEKADKAEKAARESEAKVSSRAAAAAKADELGSAVLEVATRYVGVPYLYGGNTPRGFDCSGFTQYVFGQLGVDLPHQSESQRSKGHVVSRSEAKPGDLIWVPGHVSIYVGGNKMIDSARVGTTVQFRTMWQSNPTFIRVIG